MKNPSNWWNADYYSRINNNIFVNIRFKRISGLSRFVYEPNPKIVGQPAWLVWFVGTQYKKKTQVQGYGKHTKEEGN
jgi:hypothetical protein